MHWLLWACIGVGFGLSYRLGYKLVSGVYHPLFAVGAIALIASAITFFLFVLLEKRKTTEAKFRASRLIFLFIPVVAIFTAGLEISIMMMYHAGGLFSIAQLLSSSLVGLLVFLVGFVFFNERLNPGQVIGFFVGTIGVALMTYASLF